MMTTTRFSRAICAGALGLALIGLAADPAAARDQSGAQAGKGLAFERLDRDGDGEITAAEMKAMADERFGEADRNGDGVLDRAEIEARAVERATRQAARMFERMDANGDGVVSQDEMEARRNPQRMIERLDSDNSGGLSRSEFDAGRERMRGHRDGRQGQ